MVASRSGAVFVTGGTGYIGSRLVRALLDAGEDVQLLVRPGSDTGQLGEVAGRIPIHETGFQQDELRGILERGACGAVIHLASRFLASHRGDQLPGMLEANLQLGTHLLEACVHAGVSSFINTSTQWEFWRESDSSPVCLYAATKRAFESILDFYASAHGLDCVTLALGDSYGPADPRGKIVSILVEAALRGQRLDVSPGHQRIDLLHVDDIVAAFGLTLERLREGAEGFRGRHRYELYSGEPVSLRELASAIEQATGRELAIDWGGREYREREVMEPWHVNTRLPDWRPAYDLAAGLKQLLAASEPA